MQSMQSWMESLSGGQQQQQQPRQPSTLGAPPSAQVQMEVPSSPKDRAARKADAGAVEVLVTDSAAPATAAPPGALRICTLNIGGRNTNSFEFLMAGDGSELGQRWKILYGQSAGHGTEGQCVFLLQRCRRVAG